jgi:hypothetical protein
MPRRKGGSLRLAGGSLRLAGGCRRGMGRRGGSFVGFLKKAHSWIKKNKVLSTLGRAYGSTGLPFAQQIGKAGGIAGTLGYGRRRRRR